MLTAKHIELPVNALIFFCLNYCSSLFTGITQSSLARPQLVQNSAARLLTVVYSEEVLVLVQYYKYFVTVDFGSIYTLLEFLYLFQCLLLLKYITKKKNILLLHYIVIVHCRYSLQNNIFE